MLITAGLGLVALVLVAGGALFAFRWLIGRPMFTPGSVAAHVAARGESFDPLPSGSDDRWQVTPGVALYHDSFGEGGEHVLFVHGGPALPPGARPRALEALARTHRVHLFHQRGCGASTRPFAQAPVGTLVEQLAAIEGTLGLAEQLADLERVRRALGQQRVVLVGHSFGGLVAALYAAEFPDHVSGLVLVSPAPLHVMPLPPDLFTTVRARLAERGDTAALSAYDAYLQRYFDVPAAVALDEAALSRLYGGFREFYASATGAPAGVNDGDAGGFATLATYLSLGQRHDWRAALGGIRAPTVVVHGRGDLTPEAHTRSFADAIPGARVEVVDAAHFALEEAPAAVVSAVASLPR